MWNTRLRLGGGGILGGVLGKPFVSVNVNKLGVSKRSESRSIVGIGLGETGLAVLGQ